MVIAFQSWGWGACARGTCGAWSLAGVRLLGEPGEREHEAATGVAAVVHLAVLAEGELGEERDVARLPRKELCCFAYALADSRAAPVAVDQQVGRGV